MSSGCVRYVKGMFWLSGRGKSMLHYIDAKNFMIVKGTLKVDVESVGVVGG